MSAFVLPLQGFWNAVIYAVTSWSACKSLTEDLVPGRRHDDTELNGIAKRADQVQMKRHSRHLSQIKLPVPPKAAKKLFDSESTTELAASRAASTDGNHSS